MNTEQLISATWLPLSIDNIPPPYTLLFVQRNNNSIYIAYRTTNELSTDMDASRNCYWHGNSINDANAITANPTSDWKARNSFSDVTVKYWMPIPIPAPSEN